MVLVLVYVYECLHMAYVCKAKSSKARRRLNKRMETEMNE